MLSNNYLDILNFVNEYGGITIDIAANIFYQSKFGYDNARRALRKLKDTNYLKVKRDFLTDKLVYYNKKAISSHRVMLLKAYSKLMYYGAEILTFIPEYKTGYGNADGLIIYKINGIIKAMVIEVDINNKTNLIKYDKIYSSQHFQEKIGTFPKVLIIDKEIDKRKKKDSSKRNYIVNYINYEMEDLYNFI
ncbi:hypothetical protein [Clostridium sp.]|uniref:hypothetical protein n=1 Tax=Clostridium sp. TaxID=1506 RepID=UPI001B634F91|nr:hypothetical protein [Clostridium sp.]MBP3915927.1 hypothetical protein [Clostridium sp.]